MSFRSVAFTTNYFTNFGVPWITFCFRFCVWLQETLQHDRESTGSLSLAIIGRLHTSCSRSPLDGCCSSCASWFSWRLLFKFFAGPVSIADGARIHFIRTAVFLRAESALAVGYLLGLIQPRSFSFQVVRKTERRISVFLLFFFFIFCMANSPCCSNLVPSRYPAWKLEPWFYNFTMAASADT